MNLSGVIVVLHRFYYIKSHTLLIEINTIFKKQYL